jgi:hypothetical protein
VKNLIGVVIYKLYKKKLIQIVVINIIIHYFRSIDVLNQSNNYLRFVVSVDHECFQSHRQTQERYKKHAQN